MTQAHVRLTKEHRIAALERENVVLHDKINMLHAMLKQQQQLIDEYTIRQIPVADGAVMPEEDLGTFVCWQRFEHLERRLDQLGTDAEEGTLRRQAV